MRIMVQTAAIETKEQIMTMFAQFLQQYKQVESKVFTKEEELEKAKNKQLLEKTAEYTVDNIVNGMASLQLDFGRILQGLSETLTTESSKLDELKKAITVKQEQLKQLRQVRLVADALHLLRQEHQERLRLLEEMITHQRESIEKEQEKYRELWEKEQEDFTVKIEEEAQLITKQREQEAEDYQYNIEQIRKIETDEYENTKRQQERQLRENNTEKEKLWQERETILGEKEPEFLENQKKIEDSEETLKQEYNKAKGDAIKDAEREAKVKADLLEKEWELTKQGYDFTIQSLEATIERNREQITEITTQLQGVTTQAQNLALRAFQSSSSSSNS